MAKNNHIIEKIFIEIDAESLEMANSIKNNIDVFIKKHLLSWLESEFESLDFDENTFFQIEKVNLSVDKTGLKNDFFWGSELKFEVKKQLGENLKKTIEDSFHTSKTQFKKPLSNSSHSSKERDENTLLYFLKKGTMPWWFSQNESDFFSDKNLNQILRSKKFKIEFRKIQHLKSVRKRLVSQFSNEQISILIMPFEAKNKEQIIISKNLILRKLKKESFELKQLFWMAIFDVLYHFDYKYLFIFLSKSAHWNANLSNNKIKKNNLKHDYISGFLVALNDFIPIQTDKPLWVTVENVIQNITNSYPSILKKESNSEKPEIESEKIKIQKQQNSDKPFDKESLNNLNEPFLEDTSEEENATPKTAFYIDNAGLILLHPFIKQLFKNCDLIENNALSDKELAAHLLHYAATQKECDYESNMQFEKFICGIPMQESIQRELKIDQKHKDSVEEMLQSVVEYWSALKNSSIGILRTEFLQRKGKLDLSEDNPKLVIERKTQDILLEKLPWNISIAKISWMEKLIYTEW